MNFNPRSPHGERPLSPATFSAPVVFQSTLPARGATIARELVRELLKISIHAPRTGSDARAASRRLSGQQFQSTLPARGATAGDDLTPPDECHFNPRSPHGERLPPHRGRHRPRLISIHAPRTGSDGKQVDLVTLDAISIHAPRTGSDQFLRRNQPGRIDFNPRSPHGERRKQTQATFS